jgi:hypothetical protein
LSGNMIYSGFLAPFCKVGALAGAILILPVLAYAGHDQDSAGQIASASHRIPRVSVRLSSAPLPRLCGADESAVGRFDSAWRLDLRNQVRLGLL